MILRQHWTKEQHILVYILKMRSSGEWVKWRKNTGMKVPGNHCTQYSQRHGGSGEGDRRRWPDMGWCDILFGNKKPEIPTNYIRLGEGREEREESMMIIYILFFFGLRNEVKTWENQGSWEGNREWDPEQEWEDWALKNETLLHPL